MSDLGDLRIRGSHGLDKVAWEGGMRCRLLLGFLQCCMLSGVGVVLVGLHASAQAVGLLPAGKKMLACIGTAASPAFPLHNTKQPITAATSNPSPLQRHPPPHPPTYPRTQSPQGGGCQLHRPLAPAHVPGYGQPGVLWHPQGVFKSGGGVPLLQCTQMTCAHFHRRNRLGAVFVGGPFVFLKVSP